MKTLKRFAVLASGGALAVLVTAASAQMVNDPGTSAWIPASADVTVHRSAQRSEGTKKVSESKPATQGAIRPTAANSFVAQGN
jgi:hypothetical protein